MVFLRLSLKKEMCKRSLSNEGMTGKRLHLKPVVPEHFWSREGEKTGFSPPLHVCPQRGSAQVCLVRIELTGEGISLIHGHKHSAVKTELKS